MGRFSRFSVSLLALSLTGLSGCALTSTAPAGKPDPIAFSGAVIGGENPIKGATVTFYETAATGVATNGVYVPATPLMALETTVTDSSGNFNFATPTACASSSDYVYVTAAGGNTGANAVNPNELIMSAVGSCSGFGSSSFVVVNELSSIAAAYALQGFTSVSGSYTVGTAQTITDYTIASNVATISATNTLVAGQTVILSGFATSTFLNGTYIVLSAGLSTSQFEVAITNPDVATTTEAGVATGVTVPIVSVTSSSTNYGTASATSGSLSAAGLAHAFANAANLKTASSATVNTSVPGNSGTIVPAALMNALANSVQACVNSTGGVASATTTACGKLFSYTTIGTNAAPTNTFSALLNVVRNPTQDVQSICLLTPSSGAAFSPAVKCAGTDAAPTAPVDWSLAISYNQLDGQTSGTTCSSTYTAATATNGLCYPWGLTLDASDNVYVLNTIGSSEGVTNVVAFTSAGSNLWTSALDTANTTPNFITADGLGNLFYVNNLNGTTTASLVELSATSSGSKTQTISTKLTSGYPVSVAVDSSNNVWVGTAAAAGSQNLIKYNHGSGTTYTVATLGTTPSSTGYAYQLSLDSTGDVWVANYAGSGAISPGTSLPQTATAGTYSSEITGSGLSSIKSYGMVVDSSGNAWNTTPSVINKYTPHFTSSVLTSATGASAATYTPSGGTASLRYLMIDGSNTLWTVDYNASNSALVSFNTSTSKLTALQPCIATTTSCPSTSTTGVYGPRFAQPDSTGSVWVANGTNGTVVQVIGAAAPSWPLLSDLKPGVMP